jgi:hypothetical protein
VDWRLVLDIETLKIGGRISLPTQKERDVRHLPGDLDNQMASLAIIDPSKKAYRSGDGIQAEFPLG